MRSEEDLGRIRGICPHHDVKRTVILLAARSACPPPPPRRPSPARSPARCARPASKGPLGNERLSDERTRDAASATRRRIYKVRSGPGPPPPHDRAGCASTPRTTRRRTTSCCAPSSAANGQPWLQIRVPRRPERLARAGSRAARSAACTVLTTSLEIDKRALKARLFKDGKEIWTSSIGVGAPGTPTPNGRYWVRERLPNLGGSAAYGPLAFGTAAYSRLSEWPGGGVVGIHGTNAPGLHPRPSSHGCIRVPNGKILKLDKLMPVGHADLDPRLGAGQDLRVFCPQRTIRKRTFAASERLPAASVTVTTSR